MIGVISLWAPRSEKPNGWEVSFCKVGSHLKRKSQPWSRVHKTADFCKTTPWTASRAGDAGGGGNCAHLFSSFPCLGDTPGPLPASLLRSGFLCLQQAFSWSFSQPCYPNRLVKQQKIDSSTILASEMKLRDGSDTLGQGSQPFLSGITKTVQGWPVFLASGKQTWRVSSPGRPRRERGSETFPGKLVEVPQTSRSEEHNYPNPERHKFIVFYFISMLWLRLIILLIFS